jgi:hypothetical protein
VRGVLGKRSWGRGVPGEGASHQLQPAFTTSPCCHLACMCPASHCVSAARTWIWIICQTSHLLVPRLYSIKASEVEEGTTILIYPGDPSRQPRLIRSLISEFLQLPQGTPPPAFVLESLSGRPGGQFCKLEAGKEHHKGPGGAELLPLKRERPCGGGGRQGHHNLGKIIKLNPVFVASCQHSVCWDLSMPLLSLRCTLGLI